MSALQAEAIREAVTIGRAGKVESWQVAVGDRVQKGQGIALFDDGKGGPVQITAPCSGRVVSRLHAGLPIAANTAIAQLEPDSPQEPLKRSISIAPSPATHRPSVAQPAPNNAACAPLEQEPAPPVERRSTLGDAEELMAVEELALPAPLPKPKARPRRPKMARRTTRPTDHQKDAFQERAKRFEALGYAIGEHDRAMYEAWLALSDLEVARLLEAQRDKEVAGRYCYGNGPRG